jgi:hypothetical protein
MKNAYNLAEAAKSAADSLLEEGHLKVGEAVQVILSFINDSRYPATVSYMEEVLRNVCDVCGPDQVIL